MHTHTHMHRHTRTRTHAHAPAHTHVHMRAHLIVETLDLLRTRAASFIAPDETAAPCVLLTLASILVQALDQLGDRHVPACR